MTCRESVVHVVRCMQLPSRALCDRLVELLQSQPPAQRAQTSKAASQFSPPSPAYQNFSPCAHQTEPPKHPNSLTLTSPSHVAASATGYGFELVLGPVSAPPAAGSVSPSSRSKHLPSNSTRTHALAFRFILPPTRPCCRRPAAPDAALASDQPTPLHLHPPQGLL